MDCSGSGVQGDYSAGNWADYSENKFYDYLHGSMIVHISTIDL